ncbi:MAG: hypothetical protein K5894_16300, partial [Lachnospiraceae bacterium]|nr:hypothetical protein [Lachnospiraceae bacterium]
PVMKKAIVRSTVSINASDMLTGVTYSTPDKYSSSKTSVAVIDEKTGVITPLKSGSTKITVYFGSKEYKAKLKVKLPK